jgi:hypothetical protein
MKPIAAKVREMIVQTVLNHPNRPYCEIAKEFGVTEWTVGKFARAAGIKRPSGAGSPSWRLKQAVVNG